MTTITSQSVRKNRRPLSVVIISKNEEKRIEACLQSVAWADEIIVVDSGSTDTTGEIVKRYTNRFHTIAWKGFGPQKQAAVELASYDWILNIDCDEQVTAELAEEIVRILELENTSCAFSVPRRTFINAKEIKHSGWYPDRTIRLFDRQRARFSDSLVHERVIADGVTGDCKSPVLHYSFSGIEPLLSKLNHYSELSAKQMFQSGRKSTVFDITVRPLFAFFKTYVLRAGFLDGVEGLEIAVTTSLLTFTKYIKLRELYIKSGEQRS